MNVDPRASLYAHVGQRSVVYNPVEPGEYDIVDLGRNVTNSTRVYHAETDCVREALQSANLVITDNQALGQAVRLVLPRAHVTALPYGYMHVLDPSRRTHKDLGVGLLNHSEEMADNNAYALKMLHELGRPLFVYGERLNGFDVDIVFPEDDFEGFCLACDVLLLPSAPGELNSPTLPLAAMSGGHMAILATNAAGYYGLDAATGVQLLPDEASFWRDRLDMLEQQPMRLLAMQARNQVFAHRLNRESFSRLAALLVEPVGPRPTLSDDCGCPPRVEKGVAAPPKKKAVKKSVKAAEPEVEAEPALAPGSPETLGNSVGPLGPRKGAPTEPEPIVDLPISVQAEESEL